MLFTKNTLEFNHNKNEFALKGEGGVISNCNMIWYRKFLIFYNKKMWLEVEAGGWQTIRRRDKFNGA
jgi:hypothetical protein